MDQNACASQRASAEEAVANAIDQIEHDGREPDAWERTHLIGSISLLFRGAYPLAGLWAVEALTPLKLRSLTAKIGEGPLYDCCTISLLRAGLSGALAEPLRLRPL